MRAATDGMEGGGDRVQVRVAHVAADDHAREQRVHLVKVEDEIELANIGEAAVERLDEDLGVGQLCTTDNSSPPGRGLASNGRRCRHSTHLDQVEDAQLALGLVDDEDKVERCVIAEDWRWRQLLRSTRSDVGWPMSQADERRALSRQLTHRHEAAPTALPAPCPYRPHPPIPAAAHPAAARQSCTGCPHASR